MFEWIKKDVLTSLKVGTTSMKVNVLILPAYLVSQVVVYIFFKSGILIDGYWVILLPMLIVLILSLIYLIPKRNDPKYQIYYLFHLSKFSKIVILLFSVFALCLYFFAQCRDYGFEMSNQCIKNILSTK